MTIKDLYNKIESWPEDIMNFRITDIFSWRGVYAEPACSLACIPTLKRDNLYMLNRLINEVFDGSDRPSLNRDIDYTILGLCSVSCLIGSIFILVILC